MGLLASKSVLDAAYRVLDFSSHLIGFALTFELAVTGYLACYFFHFTLGLLHRAFNAVFVHNILLSVQNNAVTAEKLRARANKCTGLLQVWRVDDPLLLFRSAVRPDPVLWGRAWAGLFEDRQGADHQSGLCKAAGLRLAVPVARLVAASER